MCSLCCGQGCMKRERDASLACWMEARRQLIGISNVIQCGTFGHLSSSIARTDCGHNIAARGHRPRFPFMHDRPPRTFYGSTKDVSIPSEKSQIEIRESRPELTTRILSPTTENIRPEWTPVRLANNCPVARSHTCALANFTDKTHLYSRIIASREHD